MSVFLPGKYHGQRSLVGYNPWGHKESDTTEQLHSCLHATLLHIKLNLFFSHVNLSYINIIIRAAKESRRKEGETFLPLKKHRLDFLDNIHLYKHSKFRKCFIQVFIPSQIYSLLRRQARKIESFQSHL